MENGTHSTVTRDGAVAARAKYRAPTIKVMTETELLTAFQMTAAEICAAGCWWGTC